MADERKARFNVFLSSSSGSVVHVYDLSLQFLYTIESSLVPKTVSVADGEPPIDMAEMDHVLVIDSGNSDKLSHRLVVLNPKARTEQVFEICAETRVRHVGVVDPIFGREAVGLECVERAALRNLKRGFWIVLMEYPWEEDKEGRSVGARTGAGGRLRLLWRWKDGDE
ncbi:hypothetical protein HDV00_007334 [Rhizophlyctis rosea]|nr:hypothetical protein HDV00_007334 [Rhizophlyctis rosea]